jgi:hypothetical protein
MNAYTEPETEPMMDQNQDNLMPGWLWLMSMILMPAATGLIGRLTGMLENGWLPETFRIMLSNTEETDNNVEKTE